MKKIPAGATEEEIVKAYAEYRAEIVRMNPNAFNPDGSLKTFRQSFKSLFTGN
jgi:hypothetical protein